MRWVISEEAQVVPRELILENISHNTQTSTHARTHARTHTLVQVSLYLSKEDVRLNVQSEGQTAEERRRERGKEQWGGERREKEGTAGVDEERRGHLGYDPNKTDTLKWILLEKRTGDEVMRDRGVEKCQVGWRWWKWKSLFITDTLLWQEINKNGRNHLNLTGTGIMSMLCHTLSWEITSISISQCSRCTVTKHLFG